MGRPEDDDLLDDLVTVSVITARLGLTRVQRVHELMRSSPPLPRPVKVLPRVQLWSWREVAAWAQNVGREVVEPSEYVPAQVLRERLDLDPNELAEGESVSSRRGKGRERLWSWRDAERVWIDRINRPRR